MKLNFTWKPKTSQLSTGEKLYLNQICVGAYEWNTTRIKGDKDPNVWHGVITLPSLTDASKNVYAPTETEVKQKVEKVVTSWFKEALQKAEKIGLDKSL